ncbi:TIGR02221 family CRISPR-associated protein [Caldicoprobacter algeriensis]|uniref:TIGR02221 family CRISPR-associated protein n=1 Tax=Caldicoprobacter algeriensis TaxID=699281 RepID=UPI00207A8891|nr:TIGR02221 family CRISPR-associated protein [Caldicoprobacter algeriensis]
MSTQENVVLISLIGKGKIEENGYRKAGYYFKETDEVVHTSFFGAALYKVLKKLGYKINQWLIFGTRHSNWSELISALEMNGENAGEADSLIEWYLKVYEEEQKGISDDILYRWEALLSNKIPGVRLLTVDPLDYEIYINTLLKEFTDERCRVVLDITHAYRHMPVIIAFSMMVLKYVKNISGVTVYYGALDMGKFVDDIPADSVPVLKIDLIAELVSMAESLATFNNSGYFVDLLSLLGIEGTERTYFWLEMNRQPRSQLVQITKELQSLSGGNDYKASIAGYLNKQLKPLLSPTLDGRMVERAKLFFSKKQYLKAIILLYEGIIIGIGRKYGFGDYLHYDAREGIRKFIKDNDYSLFTDTQKEIYYKLEYTRNAAVHGSQARGTQDTVEQLNTFEQLFKEALKLYEDIISG